MRAHICALALMALSCRGPDWIEVSPERGGFRVSFPAAAEIKVRPAVPLVRPTEVHEWELDRGSRGILQVTYYDLVAAAQGVDPKLAMELDCLHPFEGSVFVAGKPRQITMAGVPAVAVTGRAPRSDTLPDGGVSEQRCLLRGARMFQLVAVGPDTGAHAADAERFFGSLAFTP